MTSSMINDSGISGRAGAIHFNTLALPGGLATRKSDAFNLDSKVSEGAFVPEVLGWEITPYLTTHLHCT
ncbi:hypothetical protein D3C84_237920 [compost metagenome]